MRKEIGCERAQQLPGLPGLQSAYSKMLKVVLQVNTCFPQAMQANETARQQDEEQFAGQLVQVGRNANAFGVDFQNQLLNMNVFDSMLVHMATEAPAPATPSRSFSSAAVAPSPAGPYQAAPSPSHVGIQRTGATFVQNPFVSTGMMVFQQPFALSGGALFQQHLATGAASSRNRRLTRDLQAPYNHVLARGSNLSI